MNSIKKEIIQKRDNFRIDIHPSQNAKIEFDKNKMIKVVLQDISLGGCKVIIQMKSPQDFLDYYKVGSIVVIKVILHHFTNESIKSIIRNIKNENSSELIVGLEFEKLTAEQTKDLQSTLLKIDRDRRSLE